MTLSAEYNRRSSKLWTLNKCWRVNLSLIETNRFFDVPVATTIINSENLFQKSLT